MSWINRISAALFLFQIVSGFGPYFQAGPTAVIYSDAVNYCTSIGMKLVKIDWTGMQTMVGDFIAGSGLTNDVWISLDCSTPPCQWADGAVLGWDAWGTTSEPIYECVYMLRSDLTWKSAKCGDPFLPLCYAPPKPGYEIIDGNFDFYSASIACHNIGGQLAILSDPISAFIAKDTMTARMPLGDLWIGLYGNGSHMTWQNTDQAVVYSDWSPTATIPAPHDNVAGSMDMIDGKWIPRVKTEMLPHALCQQNYLVVDAFVQYFTAEKDCRKYALNMVNFHTSEEYDIAKLSIVHQGITTSDFWMGLQSFDGISFDWTDGAKLTFSAWKTNFPALVNVNRFAKTMYTSGHQWENVQDTQSNGYICQYPTTNFFPITMAIVEDFSITPPTSQTSFLPTSVPTTPPTSFSGVPSTLPSASSTLPPSASSTPPPSASSMPPPSASTTPPPSASTTPPPSASTTPPPSASTTPPPSASTTPPPSASTTPPPSASTTPPTSATITSTTSTSATPSAISNSVTHPNGTLYIGSTMQRYFEVTAFNSRPSETAFKSWPHSTLTHCAMHCLRMPNMCAVFAFKNGLCGIYPQFNSGSVLPEIGSDVYA